MCISWHVLKNGLVSIKLSQDRGLNVGKYKNLIAQLINIKMGYVFCI